MAVAKSAVIFVFTMALWGVSMAAIHWVGGFAGWTTVAAGSPLDYRIWASTRNFHVGDVIVFRYNNKFNNVVRVTHQNFKSCNATSPIAVYSSGADTINLTRPGHLYFICSIPGHCLAGQKVNIEVTLAMEHLPSSASAVYQLPQSASVSDEALAPSPESLEPIPGPTQGSAPALRSLNFWLSLVVLAFGFGVTGIGTYSLVEFHV
ncbi:hypothetical protein E1A91_D08G080600v1 [Gossypium mustelinum]|uniref:Phytocyanin domain-containing protein n=6 Tax=Gossypium TaxID=3633 RepID=A0A0D2MVD3_GOSRA|nr:mavicyanin [Gossypium raimondii]KAB2016188.1 hypothetical protein ES319_D08G078400v1 [Gossypium barbadense]MBA0795678.1 hypothetical protein [Gossypium harknessii]TYH57332.1 hypothetical protein ES332_D08G082100v1 [Gossypium tomentosum]TYI68322.1 hypothetical protein E1A91_D08G080600v1 [Gossypium mustelinum]KJB23072.1 hypothetical protein B456_004G079600 [Gossypium raimondii]